MVDPRLDLFTGDTGGIDSWLTSENAPRICERLAHLPGEPLSHALLNQTLALSQQPSVSRGFFDYYWCSAPLHPYRVEDIPDYDVSYTRFDRIESIEQLRWGLYRIYVDSLLFFGTIRHGFHALRQKDVGGLRSYFHGKMFDPERLAARGEAISPIPIARDDRYLIGELACKSFDPSNQDKDAWHALYGAYVEHRAHTGGRITYKQLLDAAKLNPEFLTRQMELTFISEELLDEVIDNEDQLRQKYDAVKGRFDRARPAALGNTDLYLSMAEDLDVYVATSMRNRDQFRQMATFCDHIFGDPSLKHYNLRYFDPTLSAAKGHEDKGLIECLMVKCAKVLIYMVGGVDSYGKDVEAGMALSQGKPVIFFSDAAHRLKIFQDVHPLSRLVDFTSGVPVGLMATSSLQDVVLLLHRIFGNQMRYKLEHKRKGYFRLVEDLTKSVVRVQTDDKRLRETFWNVYHRADTKSN
jgi:hypothetical protein